MQIYVNRNGQQMGPFDESVIREMLRNGQLSNSDYGIRQGQQQWQKLEAMFPPANPFAGIPNPQPISPSQITPPKPGRSTGLIVGLLGCGGLLLVGLAGIIGLFYVSKSSTTVGTNSSNSNVAVNSSPTPAKADYTEIASKKDELAKLKPPMGLEKKAVLKGKTLIIEQRDKTNEYSTDLIGFPYGGKEPVETELSEFGLTKEKVPTKITELDTLVQYICGKGREVGKYGPITAYVPAYANSCKILIIDYRNSKVVFQKIIENAKRPQKISVRDDENEYILPMPKEEIKKYLKELPKE